MKQKIGMQRIVGWIGDLAKIGVRVSHNPIGRYINTVYINMSSLTFLTFVEMDS